MMQFLTQMKAPLFEVMFKDVCTTAIKIFKVMKDQEYDEVIVIMAEFAGTNHLAEPLIS